MIGGVQQQLHAALAINTKKPLLVYDGNGNIIHVVDERDTVRYRSLI